MNEEVKRVYSSSFRADTCRDKERMCDGEESGRRGGRKQKQEVRVLWSEPVAARHTPL